jgi:prolyl-tRNA editing enzyme YbaK/EbsC (Cys-tRNA(Pro) deacylase)
MSDPARRVQEVLSQLPIASDTIPCDPEKADTAVFCEHYGYAPEDSANTILVAAKTGEKRVVACVVLADSRLDVNHVVRKRLESRRVSFASSEQTREMTGMEIGGVTPLALPPDMALWVDARVMTRERIVLGGGSRDTKVVVSPAVFEHLENVAVIEGLAKRIED